VFSLRISARVFVALRVTRWPICDSDALVAALPAGFAAFGVLAAFFAMFVPSCVKVALER
jgi:hypothetical protein